MVLIAFYWPFRALEYGMDGVCVCASCVPSGFILVIARFSIFVSKLGKAPQKTLYDKVSFLASCSATAA